MIEQPKSVAELVEGKSILCGCVTKGDVRQEYWFEKAPENVASFLMTKGADADEVVLTDVFDEFVMSAYGCFVDACADTDFLSEVLTHLVPMQQGICKPYELFCPTIEEVEAYSSGPRSNGLSLQQY